MLSTTWGIVRNGKVEPIEATSFPEGARVLVTVMQEEDVLFWRTLSEESLKSVWDNVEDDVYADFLIT